MQGNWIVDLGLCCLAELLSDLPLGLAKDDARVTLSPGLRLHGHRIFKRCGNQKELLVFITMPS